MAQGSPSNAIRLPSLAKLSRPRLGQIVHRERLITRSNQLSSYVCTWDNGTCRLRQDNPPRQLFEGSTTKRLYIKRRTRGKNGALPK